MTPQPTVGPPSIASVSPRQGRLGIETSLYIVGAEFAPGIQAQLNGTGVAVQFIDPNLVVVTAPGTLPVGQYDLTLMRPDNAQAIFPAAFQVISGQDLYANTPSLWTDPRTLRQGEPANMGLTVYRMADVGAARLASVEVRFYQGNPAAGGQLLGASAATNLAAGGWADSGGVAWTPPAAGNVTLYAVIDPGNVVEEVNEINNVISRTVTVQAAATDRTPPVIARFVANERTLSTVSNPNVQMAINASDPTVAANLTGNGIDSTDGSGVARILLREYRWEDGAQAWLETRTANLTYHGTPLAFNWTLSGAAGRKLLRAWAVDGAGNLSAPADVQLILGYTRVPQSHWHTYLLPAQAGQTLAISIGQLRGHPQDPDLYVWSPRWPEDTRAWWSILYPLGSPNAPRGQRDAVVFTAPETGNYRIGVYGWTTADYDLAINVTGTAGMQQDLSVVVQDTDEILQIEGVNEVQEDKPVEETPPPVEEAAPSINEAPPDLPAGQNNTSSSIFLPLINR